jgi:hypothetical protein
LVFEADMDKAKKQAMDNPITLAENEMQVGVRQSRRL